MASVLSDIVQYRARSVISRYLHQRGEPKVTQSPVNSSGVQQLQPNGDNPSGTEVLPSAAHLTATPQFTSPTIESDLAPATEPDNEQSTRTRFPPLPDDYDIHSLNVFDLLDYLSELSFSRELKLGTARCYRRWLAAYLEDANHVDAMRVRHWVIPHSPEYYEMLLLTTDQLDTEREAAAATIEKVKPREDQLDMFSSESAPSNNLASKDELAAHFTKDAIQEMMFQSLRIKESSPIAEYDYISADVTDILCAALTSKKASGGYRYKHGELAAALFTGTVMLGLRPREWQHATYHELYTDPQTLLTLGPVIEVYTLKQEKRRDDNPLREKRLIVLDKFREPEKVFLKGLLTVVHSHDDNMDKMLNNIRMTLANVWKKLVKEGKVKQTTSIKKRGRIGGKVGNTEISDGYGVNLYTARHVFAEEVKRSGLYTRFELAAMIGHTTTVNQRYYTLGNKRILKTYSHTLPRPWPGDALDIERWCDEVIKKLSPEEIERLRMDGVFYPTSGSAAEIERHDSVEDFYNR